MPNHCYGTHAVSVAVKNYPLLHLRRLKKKNPEGLTHAIPENPNYSQVEVRVLSQVFNGQWQWKYFRDSLCSPSSLRWEGRHRQHGSEVSDDC